MSDVATNLKTVKDTLPASCTLVAVSKTKPMAAIEAGYGAGHLDFGENKVQELVQKAETLPKDIRWHMIGHLQRNKVKYIASFVHLIHGVDSLKLLTEINKRAAQENRVIHCLLQVHIAEEATKFGFDEKELLELVKSSDFKKLEHIQVDGLMGMATFTQDLDQVRREFRSLRTLFNHLKDVESDRIRMDILSMGMSGDYQIALEEGSTMVRIGSAIFGERNYPT